MIGSSQTNRPTVRLHPEERIIREGAPLPGLFWSGAVYCTISLLLIGLFGGPFFTVFTDDPISVVMAPLSVVMATLILILPAVFRRRIGWNRWWITNQRLVVRTGFIGWRLQSVPLDRIVDVTIKSSWWDRLFGLEHIKVRDMTGEVSGNGISQALHLLAVPDAHEVAEVLLTASPRVPSSPGEVGEVVKLLKGLVAKTS
jgi:membrane protein YdbS with pleckstrin-like domain